MPFLRDLIVRIRGDKSNLDATLRGAEGSIQSFSSKAGTWLKGVFATGAILAFGKAVIDSTDGLKEGFTAAIAGAKEASQVFFRAIANADFKNLVSGLKEAYQGARDFAQEMNALEDLQAYNDYVQQKLKADSAALAITMKNQDLDIKVRKDAAEKRKKIEEDIQTRSIALAQRRYDIEKRDWERRNKLDAEQTVKAYAKIQTLPFKEQDRIEKVLSFQKEKFGMDITKTPIQSLEDVLPTVSRDVLEAYKQILSLDQKEQDSIQQLFKLYERLDLVRTESDERFKATMREYDAIGKQEGGIAGKELDKSKALNSYDSSGYKLSKIQGRERGPMKLEGFTPVMQGQLADVKPVYDNTIDQIEKLTKGLYDSQSATNDLANAFQDLFQGGSKGFEMMVQSMIRSIERLVSEIIAKKVIQLLIQIIGNKVIPGLGSMVSNGVGALGTSPGISGGGLTNGGTLLSSAGVPSGEFKLRGADLYLSVKRAGEKINNAT